MKRPKHKKAFRKLKRNFAPDQWACIANGSVGGTVAAPTEIEATPIWPRIVLVLIAVAVIGYALTHNRVRIEVGVDLTRWKQTARVADAAAINDQMKFLAGSMMNELARQGVFPESVEVDDSTILITAQKAPTTGMRLSDMVDNMKDCRVGAFAWEGTSMDVAMLQQTTRCEELFDSCVPSEDTSGKLQLNVGLTELGRTHLGDFTDTMVFVKAALPIATIYNYRVDNNGKLVLLSSGETPEKQRMELARICDAVQNKARLDGVAFTSITTSRIGLNLPSL